MFDKQIVDMVKGIVDSLSPSEKETHDVFLKCLAEISPKYIEMGIDISDPKAYNVLHGKLAFEINQKTGISFTDLICRLEKNFEIACLLVKIIDDKSKGKSHDDIRTTI